MRAHVGVISRFITRIYAALVLLLGCALTLIGLMMFQVMHIGSEPVPIIAAMLIPGLIFVVLSAFIWRGRIWAAIAAWVFALLYWFLLWTDAGEFLTLIVIPVVFGLLATLAFFYRPSRADAGAG